MAIIAQKELFSWNQVDASSDLDRLKMVLNVISDEPLMRVLEKKRDGRRDDYPIRAVWNSVLAGVVFQHKSVESLRRELLRNGELRELCGFSVLKGEGAVPPAWVYTRFLKSVFDHQEEVDGMFDRLVERLRKILPGFGKRLGIDSKGVESHAVGKEDPRETSDPEASWGVRR